MVEPELETVYLTATEVILHKTGSIQKIPNNHSTTQYPKYLNTQGKEERRKGKRTLKGREIHDE